MTDRDFSPDEHKQTFGADWWEHHYQDNPNSATFPKPHLIAEMKDHPVGDALDAGCGEGADAIWLAQLGWNVTAIDISPTAIANAEQLAILQPPAVAQRVTWIMTDITTWEPPQLYDLVISQYVHPIIPFDQFIAGLSNHVAPGGTLFVAGHDHADEHANNTAPRKASITGDDVVAFLDTQVWNIDVAEVRTEKIIHGKKETTTSDLVVKCRRKR